MFKQFLRITLLLALVVPTVFASNLTDQVITWADFSHVVRLTSSMNYVYAATTEGVIRYSKIDRQFEDPLTGRIGLRGNDILGLWADTFDKKLRMTTDAGKFEYDQFFEEWTEVTEYDQFESDVTHVATPSGMLPPFGFNILNDGTIVDRFGRDFPINDMIDDGTGTLWIGTWGYGLAQSDRSSKTIDLLPYGLIQNGVSALLDEDSVLWIGGPALTSYRTGLTAFNLSKNSFSYVESGLSNSFPITDVYSLAGNKAALFIGTSDGLFVYSRELGRVTDQMTERNGLIEPEVSALQVVGDSLFVGTTGGIALLDFPRDSITYPYPDIFYNSIIYDFELVDRTLWIASSVGAYRLNLDTGEMGKYQDPDDILFSRVYALDRYHDDLGLLGDDGFVRLNLKTGQSRGYQETTMHIGNNLYPFTAFAINDQVAAVSSQMGFALFFDDKKKPVYREFGTQDGLPSDNVMVLDFDGNYLWVGTDRGLSSFWWNNPNRVD